MKHLPLLLLLSLFGCTSLETKNERSAKEEIITDINEPRNKWPKVKKKESSPYLSEDIYACLQNFNSFDGYVKVLLYLKTNSHDPKLRILQYPDIDSESINWKKFSVEHIFSKTNGTLKNFVSLTWKCKLDKAHYFLGPFHVEVDGELRESKTFEYHR